MREIGFTLNMRRRKSMRMSAILGRLLLLLALCPLAMPRAWGEAPTRDQQRARKLAARRYEGMAVSLPSTAVANGLRVCARETPSGILGYWRVPPKAVARMDGELMAHLRKSGIAARLPFSPKLYIRQYVGFVRDGARFVYINAVLAERGSPGAAQAKKAFPASCSSVSGSWGIQYDTKAKKFMSFSPK
jgi:hypothetical protein